MGAVNFTSRSAPLNVICAGAGITATTATNPTRTASVHKFFMCSLHMSHDGPFCAADQIRILCLDTYTSVPRSLHLRTELHYQPAKPIHLNQPNGHPSDLQQINAKALLVPDRLKLTR